MGIQTMRIMCRLWILLVLLRFSFRAIGVVDAEVVGAMSRAWAELTGTRLKGLVETGTRLGINPDKPPRIRPIK